MGLHIPGLKEALGKLDDLPEKMEVMTSRLDRVIELLEETNQILNDTHNLHTER